MIFAIRQERSTIAVALLATAGAGALYGWQQAGAWMLSGSHQFLKVSAQIRGPSNSPPQHLLRIATRGIEGQITIIQHPAEYGLL